MSSHYSPICECSGCWQPSFRSENFGGHRSSYSDQETSWAITAAFAASNFADDGVADGFADGFASFGVACGDCNELVIDGRGDF